VSASRVVGRLGTLVPIVSRADCQWTVAGLAPGNYEADLLLPTRSGGSSPMFTISRQEITKVTIPPPAVLVDGSISLNGRPLANARLDFLNSDLAAFGTDTTTDADGRYAVTLARSGKYQLLVRARSAASAQKNVELRPGPNTVDLAIAGPGSISVRVKDARPEFPVTVHIEPGRVTNDTELARGGELSFTKEGLDFRTYHVSATEGADRGVRTSAIKLVTLDSKHPAAAVELEIVENRSSLILVDQSDNPVRNANVRATTPVRLVGPAYQVKEARPGMY
jgi:hypothetical protein